MTEKHRGRHIAALRRAIDASRAATAAAQETAAQIAAEREEQAIRAAAEAALTAPGAGS